VISLSTHVLDTGRGLPAAGVRVELVGVGEATTDADGRALLAEGLAPGDYRLVFHPPSSFFARVELTMRLEEGHYHVPLLVSPFACVSYRGS
jgi:5-hydroxyisourate hydrolase